MKFTLKFFLYLILSCVFGMLLFSFISGYEGCMHYLINAIGEAARADKIMELVAPDKFLILQSIGIFCIVVLASILVLFEKIWSQAAAVFIYFKRQIQLLVTDLLYTEVKWVLVIPLISSVFFAVSMPVSYDEAWTYLQFTAKSPLASLCYYPAPNNHVLHSLITNVTRYIPFFNPLLCLRISSIAVSFFCWLICFSFIKKYYSKNSSLLIVGIASMLFMSVYYSYMSRGYGLVLLFFIVSLYAAYNIIFNADQTRHWLIFSISNVLGFFTMPSFLYVFIILNLVILLNNGLRIKKQFFSNAAVLAVVFVLYLPIIIINGIGALTNNQFVKPIARTEVLEKLPDFFSRTISEITGVHYLVILLFILISILMLIKNKMKFELILLVVFLLAPVILLIGHAVIPFPRTFNYYAFVFVFAMVIPFGSVLGKKTVGYILLITLCIQSACFFNFYYSIEKYEGFNISYHEINKKITGRGSYFFTTVLFETNFLFENKTQGYEAEKLEFHFPQINVDADTLKGFDYYIVDKQYDFTKIKKPAYSDSRTNVYVK